MRERGIVIAFSGAMAAGSSEISKEVAARLGWRYARFSDHIRAFAREHGEDASDRAVLQRLGQRLVTNHLEEFVSSTLVLGEWATGRSLILDGLRHAEVVVELRRQLSDCTSLHVVHIELLNDLRVDRARNREGLDANAFAHFAADLTEAQLERVLPAYADLIVDAAQGQEAAVELVLDRFGKAAQAPNDDGEAASAMEPMHISGSSKHRMDLANLAADLLSESKDFTTSVPMGLKRSLTNLVRAMNCYYSNFIEGHETHPHEIDRALKKDFSTEPKKRDLQREARAHIETQHWIDEGGLAPHAPTSQVAVQEIHRRFCSALPDSMLWVANTETGERWRLTPGRFRDRPVKVGRHVAPSPGSLPRFMSRFEMEFGRLRRLDSIIAAAGAHHRLLWVHPFADGNGRVARLMTHATFLEVLDTSGLWSVARGLARAKDAYKAHLAACDLGRRNDLDGRGNLSEEALAEFTRFFLECCLDQVRFMCRLVRPDELRVRWALWIKEQVGIGAVHRNSLRLVNALLQQGDLTRHDAAELLGVKFSIVERDIRRLIDVGCIQPAPIGDRLVLHLSIRLAERITPGLFP